ncbi:MAG: endonuclease/exonuclease/phosphatase family protein [Chitinophagaceae bacterium]|nr:endonuclease/exonuclease/phosphatase family protein [Chitinophagaceae bacterium]
MAFKWFRKYTKRSLVLLNLVVAIFFLVGCYTVFFNAPQFWFLGVFNLSAFYLLLVLLFFILFWLFAKIKYAIIGIIAIAIAWKPMQHLVQLRQAPNFVLKKHPANIRIMSWNIEHFAILENKTNPGKKEQMLQLIRQYNPDVLCMQEAVASDSISGAINYLPDIMNRLNMGYYHYSYNRKIDFDSKHHFGILVLSKFPLASRHTLSHKPNDYNSIFQYVDVIKEQDTFRVFNIHLQSLKFSESNRVYLDKPEFETKEDVDNSKSIIGKYRTGFIKKFYQSNRIKTAINESKYPVIVCGDFNDVPNSYAYSTIGKGLKNAFAEKGTGIGRTFVSISPTLRIDNIFVDKRFTVEQYVRIKRNLSDHYAISADLFFNKTATP